MGMHLKEYTYQELKELLEQAGFKDICAVLRIPPKIVRLSRVYIRPRASRFYLSYLCAVEKLISLLPLQSLRRKVAYLAMAILFSPGIILS